MKDEEQQVSAFVTLGPSPSPSSALTVHGEVAPIYVIVIAAPSE